MVVDVVIALRDHVVVVRRRRSRPDEDPGSRARGERLVGQRQRVEELLIRRHGGDCQRAYSAVGTSELMAAKLLCRTLHAEAEEPAPDDRTTERSAELMQRAGASSSGIDCAR